MSIIFQNKGVIDKKSITAFGVSSKENPSAIGYFGTGLKYAIAILLRHGLKVTIFAGKERINFGIKKTKLRVDEFNFVTMNRRTLDFTTEVGKKWELWQAFRELWCNTMDEGGEVNKNGFELTEIATWANCGKLAANATTIVVEGPAFEDIYEHRYETIVLNSEPLCRHDKVWIHPGPSKYLYYKGIRVCELNTPSLYTYNLQGSVSLTEDRTLSNVYMETYTIRNSLAEVEDEDIIRKVVTAPECTWEHNLTFENVSPRTTFLRVVEPLAMAFAPELNKTCITACRGLMNKRLTSSQTTPPPLEVARIAKAVAFCYGLGFKVDEYPILLSEFLGESVLGLADRDSNTIFISRRALMGGTKVLVGTLIEEYLHLKHRLDDETRGMQNFLLDTVVTLGEMVLGVPL